jgi:hypothetical protein
MLVIVLALGAASPATAQDSMAPAGASPHYLPKADWVYRHWSPVDEGELAQALQLGDGELEAYLFDDHRSLDTLAAARGIALTDLLDRLTAWTQPLSPDRAAVVRERAEDVLTQPHLAQHLFFHVYHGVDARGMAPQLSGMTPKRYWHLRLHGRTPRQTAHAGHVAPADAEAGLVASFAADRDEGIRLQVTPPSEARTLYDRRVAQLPCWMTRPLPSQDPASPYAHEQAMHGRWYARMPRTAAQRRSDEAAVERFRRHLPSSCWPVPAAWSWAAHGLTPP